MHRRRAVMPRRPPAFFGLSEFYHRLPAAKSRQSSIKPRPAVVPGARDDDQFPPRFPLGTLIDARFRYEENGRLTIVVTVGNNGTELRHEITRDNTLTQEQLDSWREYIKGIASGG